MKKTIASLFTVSAILSFFIAGAAAFISLNAFIERMKNGPGLMFADAEFLILVSIFFILCGIVSLWISKRIKKNLNYITKIPK